MYHDVFMTWVDTEGLFSFFLQGYFKGMMVGINYIGLICWDCRGKLTIHNPVQLKTGISASIILCISNIFALFAKSQSEYRYVQEGSSQYK